MDPGKDHLNIHIITLNQNFVTKSGEIEFVRRGGLKTSAVTRFLISFENSNA